LIDYFEQKGISLKRSMIEFGSTGLRLARGGIEIDEHAQASLAGLYASGNICGNASGGVTCAAVFGAIAGEQAAAYAGETPFVPVDDHPLIPERQALYQSLLERQDGAHWKEVNATLAQIMQDYLGADLKSETMMSAGLDYLRALRARALEEMQARNSHELMRAVEVIDLLDMGEVSFQSVLNRKESRGQLKRSDYKYTNPLLSGQLETIEKRNGVVTTAFRKTWRK
jgi:succinate dehydrogenase/fumarate reductase flavoprotein subunit